MSSFIRSALPYGLAFAAIAIFLKYTIFSAISTPMLKRMFRNKLVPPKDPTHVSFKGKTVVITGANVGLGFEAAVKFATQGASRLILAVRNAEKGEAAKAVIEERAKEPGCHVEVWELDMDSYDSIKAFAKRAETELERLDLALLNAGVWFGAFRQSKYGWDEVLQVNTLSTTLLALLLLPIMKRFAANAPAGGSTPVLELTSSGTYRTAQVGEERKKMQGSLIEEFSKEENFIGRKNYGISKLFLMCAWPELRAIADSTGGKDKADVLIPAICPGACKSELARDANSAGLRIAKVIAGWIFLRTTEEGSRTLVSGTQIGEKGNGGLWQHDEIQPAPEMLEGEEGEKFQKKVWSDILEAIRKDVPEVMDYVKGSS